MSRLIKNTRSKLSQVSVPTGLAIATEWSWRLIVIAASLALFSFIVSQLSFVVIPLLVALLLAAIVSPLHNLLLRWRLPRPIATLLSIISLIGVVVAIFWTVISAISSNWSSLQERSFAVYQDFVDFLLRSPLAVSEEQIQEWFEQFADNLDTSSLLSGALSIGSSLGSLVVGLILALFALIFFINDGERIWNFLLRLVPRNSKAAIDGAGNAGWGTFTSFVKAQVIVALIDAIGIGLGAWILGLPLALPIALIVFLGSFIPIVGAFVTGALAIFVALVYQGFTAALIMFAIVIVVQQVEGQILQPFIIGKSVRIHPLAVVLAVTIGAYLAGIPGALFAVPLLALVNVFIRYIASGAWKSTTSNT
jgi:predicted PurR-regulated permease PerM